MLPFLIHTSPDVARSLLMHRVRMLPDARRRAREVGCSGALFPWRTINGQEASAYYAAGTAQYHINADIAYAFDQYIRVTGDTDLLFRHGVELLVETARMWADLGFFSDRRGGRFVIHEVTGPDEYTTVVHNNLFTNLMAAENLRIAAEAVDRVRTESPPDYRRVVERTGLTEDEITTWRRAAEQIYIPYDEESGIHLQADGFLDQKPWDFASTPPDRYPLLLHFHPLVLYRHQVIKQADVVLATVMLHDRFTDDERRRIFDYDDPLTTGDSSLSECIQAIAAADAGKYRTAEDTSSALSNRPGRYRRQPPRRRPRRIGRWRMDGDRVRIRGIPVAEWNTGVFPGPAARARRLRFPLRMRGSVLEVDIEERQVTYSVRRGDPVTARHRGEEFTVSSASPVSFKASTTQTTELLHRRLLRGKRISRLGPLGDGESSRG